MAMMSDLSHTQNRRPLAALGKVAIGVLVGIAFILAYTMIVVDGQPDVALFIFIAMTLGCTALVATGWRWAPLLATLLSAAMLGGYLPQIGTILTDHHRPDFVITVIFLPLAVVGIVTGIAATAQNYRSSGRATPRWLPITLAALAGLAVGAILITNVPHDDSGIGVSAESLVTLPGIAITNFRFDQSEIRIRAGEVIALRLDNHDTTPHSFDVMRSTCMFRSLGLKVGWLCLSQAGLAHTRSTVVFPVIGNRAWWERSLLCRSANRMAIIALKS